MNAKTGRACQCGGCVSCALFTAVYHRLSKGSLLNSEPRERKRETQGMNRDTVSDSRQLARSSVQNTCMRKHRIGNIRVCRHPFSLRQENREFEGSLT